MFKDAGLIEKYGSGIRRILQACIEAGLPAPVFEEVAQGFQVTLFRFTGQVPENRRLRILSLIKATPAITAVQLAHITSVSEKTIKRDLDALKSSGAITRHGPDKGGWWEVARKD